jgi:hypothetical protein
MVEKTPAFRRRRANDTARWRARVRRGRAVYPLEIDASTFDLMEQYAGLKPGQMDNRQAVSVALGRLLHLAISALLRETASRC